MPLLGTRGVASARGFGFFGGRASIGAPYWIGTLGGVATDTGYSVAVDTEGNVYLCGRANSGAQFGYQLAKYSAAGVIQWQRKLGGTGSNSNEQGLSIAVDAQSNVYVTGFSFNGDDNDVVTAKYNTSGTLQWQRQLQSSGAVTDQGRGIAVTSAGDVYVCGNTNAGGPFVLILAKYNTSGTIQWQRSLGLTGSSVIGRGVSLDSSGNVYVVGDRNQQYFEIAKYNPSGTLQWQIEFGNGQQVGYAVAVDASGNSYVCGLTEQPGARYFQIAKFNTSGTIQWQRNLGTGNSGDIGYGISVDSSNNVYITGQTFSANEDVLLAKYNTSGTIQWQRTISTTGTDIGYGVANDISDNLYLCAQTNTSGTVDFLFAKLPGNGSRTGTYTVGGRSFTYASASLADSSTSLTTASNNLTAGTSSLTAGTSGLPSNTSTLTSAVTTI